MTDAVEIGVFLSHANELLGSDLSRLTEVARAIDEAGIVYVSVADHVLLGTDLDGHGSLGGSLAYASDEPYPDPLVTLTAIAAVTDHVRLMTGILVAPLRPAVVLAKMAATLDVISRGRLDLGVGTGWQAAEFDAVGVPMDGRVGRMDDAIHACQHLWRSRIATFASDTVAFRDMSCSPRPYAGDIPVWFAGRPIRATLARVVAMGAGWLPLRAMTPETARHVVLDIRRACEEAGRDPGTVGIRMPLGAVHDDAGRIDVTATSRSVYALREAGVTGVHFALKDLARSSAELPDILLSLGALAA